MSIKAYTKRAFTLTFAPITIRVIWGTEVFTHKAWGAEEMVEWLETYPKRNDEDLDPISFVVYHGNKRLAII